MTKAPKKSWYAAVITANNSKKGTITSSPIALTAVSDDEALGIAINEAKKRFPEEDGYDSHKAGFVRIPLKNWKQE